MKRLVAALLLSASPALAFDPAAMSDAEKTAFGAAVRAYLLENPQVLVEVISTLEQQQAEGEAAHDRAMVAAHAEALFADGHSWVGGNPDGDLTMVAFIDYRCGVCRRFNDAIHDTTDEDGNIRLILKEFPILGPDSEASSRFAVAVRQVAGDDAYIRAHEALMALQGPASPAALGKLADEIGVDGKAVLAAMEGEAVTAVLAANAQLGEAMGIRGTPTFVIGDALLRGVPQAGLAATVQAIRQSKG